MSFEKNQKKLSSNYDEIESYHNRYLGELVSLSKLFITLSVAILGLALTVLAPALKEKIAPNWFIATYIFLIITICLGFGVIFFFSRRFKAKADYLYGCMMEDIAIDLKRPDDILEEFSIKSNLANEKFKSSYRWSVALVAAQTISLFVAFMCLSFFVYKNFLINLPNP